HAWDWLGPSILTVKAVAAAVEPFPCVRAVFGTIIILFEAVEKVKKNREDLKGLCESAMEIVGILEDQISTHGDTAAVKLRALCEQLEGLLQAVLLAITKMQTESRGLRGHLKEIIQMHSITDEIGGYQKNIQGLCSKLKVWWHIKLPTHVPKLMNTSAYGCFPAQHPIQKIINCPFPSRIFHGRQNILAKMHQFFTQSLDHQHIYILHGLGGAGKTQIALKFIRESLSQYVQIRLPSSRVFFIDTTTIETIDTGLKSIAVEQHIGDTSREALKWLETKQDPWLLVFDNADDPGINLNGFIPQCDHGNILITSRNPGLCVYAGADSLVSDMEESDAVALLLKCALQDMSPANQQTATKIVKVLCYHALAIIQAGAFIAKSGALETYLALYTRNQAQLLSEKPTQSHENYAWTVYTTWQISFAQLSQSAAMFLQLCSFLHHKDISEDIFSKASLYKFPSSGPTKRQLRKPLEFLSYFLTPTGAWDPLRFLNVVNEIKAYSLINFDPTTQMFSIHPLVHAWSQAILSDPGLYNCIAVSIFGIACRAEIAIHIKSLKYVENYLYSGRAKEAECLAVGIGMANLAETYRDLGNFTEAQRLEVVVLQKRREICGNNSSDTLDAMSSLASTYRKGGDFIKAKELDLEVLERRKRLWGDDNPNTLVAMGLEKAEELEVVVLEKRTNLWGDEHPDTLIAMGNLASTYWNRGEFTKAEKLEVTVLNKQEKLLGGNHPDTLLAMGNLARTYSQLGNLKKAQELEGLVVEKRTMILGDDHPDTLLTMGNLAGTYSKLGDAELLGDSHPDTLLAMGNLAGTCSRLGELKEAEELGTRASTHLLAMHNLAGTYTQLGKEPSNLERFVNHPTI
ncbi:hypothetical protein B0H14DRAFT_2924625, partial [Mycena olivaceomarginata]